MVISINDVMALVTKTDNGRFQNGWTFMIDKFISFGFANRER